MIPGALAARSPSVGSVTARQSSCGKLVSEAAPSLDPARVAVPAGQCTVSPGQVEPPADVSLSATVRNRNDMAVVATVEWTWQGQSLGTAEVGIRGGGQATTDTTATISSTGDGQVTAEVIEVRKASAGFQPVTDGGIEFALPFAGCGGCKRRSRTLTQRHQRDRARLDPQRG